MTPTTNSGQPSAIVCPNCMASLRVGEDKFASQNVYIQCPRCQLTFALSAVPAPKAAPPRAMGERFFTGIDDRSQEAPESKIQNSCPMCLHDQVDLKLKHLTVAYCPECSGLWIPVAGFEQLTSHRLYPPPVQSQIRDASQKAPQLCSKCGGQFELFDHPAGSGLNICWCKQCQGVWVPTATFKKIQARHLSER